MLKALSKVLKEPLLKKRHQNFFATSATGFDSKGRAPWSQKLYARSSIGSANGGATSLPYCRGEHPITLLNAVLNALSDS